MTRKEEIERIARDYENKIIENNPCAESYDYMNSVIYGAKWADKTMIDKVCQWIREKAEYNKNLFYNAYLGNVYFLIEELKNDMLKGGQK